MSDGLCGRVVLVTGGGRGIGRAIALACAREGAPVAVAARTQSEMEVTVNEIEAGGGRALACHADVSRAQDVEEMVAHTLSAFGQIDVLFNNAGVGGPQGTVSEISEADWDRTLAINLTGAFLCCRAVVPAMIAGGGGNIVNVSSGAGFRQPRPFVRSLAYQVSKFGLEGLTHGLAIQLRQHRINVNSLLPGMIATRIHDDTAPEWVAAMGGKMGKPEDVVAAAVFLASRPPGDFTDQVVNARDFKRR